MTTVPTDPFLPLRERLTGSLVTSCDGYWDVARAAWVLGVDRRRPSAVVHAETAQDVVATVDFAEQHGLRVAVQGAEPHVAPLRVPAGTLLLETARVHSPEVLVRLQQLEQRSGTEDLVRSAVQ